MNNIIIVLLITCIGLSGTINATIWVGGDANCDYSSIQPALDELVSNSETQLYIANNNTGNGVYTENLELIYNQGVQIRIKGGFDHCEGSSTQLNTEINGSGTGPVMTVIGDDSFQSISLSNLSLKNGLYDNSLHAGGLNIIDKKLSISLDNMNISNNQGYLGGGVYFNGDETLEIILYNTLITNNTAEFGGGMYCENAYSVTMWDRSGIAYNTATSNNQFGGNGGGIYLEDECFVSVSSGSLDQNSLEGIVGNSAKRNGGGTYVTGDSHLELRQTYGTGKYIVYSDNIADVDNDGNGDGGAIYVSGANATFSTDRKDIVIKNNSAINGGAIAIVNAANAYIDSYARCSMEEPCIKFSGNTAGQNSNSNNQGLGGTFYVKDATALVSRAEITASQADLGIIAYVENGTLDVRFSMIHNNGGTVSTQYNQNNLFVTFSSFLGLIHTTLVDNIINATEALLLAINDANLEVRNSIIQGIGYSTLETFTSAGTNLNKTFKCNIMNEVASIGNSIDISDNTITANPGFVNSSQQNYHLVSGSVAIDKCDEVNTTPFVQTDLEGEPTGFDDPSKVDVLGTYDAGADEFFIELIFSDDFE